VAVEPAQIPKIPSARLRMVSHVDRSSVGVASSYAQQWPALPISRHGSGEKTPRWWRYGQPLLIRKGQDSNAGGIQESSAPTKSSTAAPTL